MGVLFCLVTNFCVMARKIDKPVYSNDGMSNFHFKARALAPRCQCVVLTIPCSIQLGLQLPRFSDPLEVADLATNQFALSIKLLDRFNYVHRECRTHAPDPPWWLAKGPEQTTAEATASIGGEAKIAGALGELSDLFQVSGNLLKVRKVSYKKFPNVAHH